MKNIYLTGHSGFVGKNLVQHLKNNFRFTFFNRNENIIINDDFVIHLAGKAHDLKNHSSLSEYYLVNTELTKRIFDSFLTSKASCFIFLSSVKAVADFTINPLKEDVKPLPITDYGKSKLLAEDYILNAQLPLGKRVYILRPCMIHGPNNKGNLNLLYKVVKNKIPWPLGAYNNKRSFCYIGNLIFIIEKLLCDSSIASGVYNISDNDSISTIDLIKTIGLSLNFKPVIFNIPKPIIEILAKLGSFCNLPFNQERLFKLTENFEVSNKKIVTNIRSELPYSVQEGLLNTLESFKP